MRVRRGPRVAAAVAVTALLAWPGAVAGPPPAAPAAARPMIVIVPGHPSAPGMPGIRGYGPGELRSAYGLDGTASQGRWVALVDAFDDPNAEADLAVGVVE